MPEQLRLDKLKKLEFEYNTPSGKLTKLKLVESMTCLKLEVV